MYLEPQTQLRHSVKEQRETIRVKREPLLTGFQRREPFWRGVTEYPWHPDKGHQNLGTHPVFSANFTKPLRSLR